MVAVTQQSMWDVMESLPDEQRLQVYNFAVSLKPKKSEADRMSSFEADMDRCQQWAKDVGLTPDDITRAIKKVRQRKRQNA